MANSATPTQQNIISSKWVFHIKCKADGSINKFKACLVAQGFTQIYGVDYFDIYSPIAKLSSIQLILMIIAHYDWNIDSFNFISAYPFLFFYFFIHLHASWGTEPHMALALQCSLIGNSFLL